MKVYLVQEREIGENFQVHGCYATRKLAEKKKASLVRSYVRERHYELPEVFAENIFDVTQMNVRGYKK